MIGFPLTIADSEQDMPGFEPAWMIHMLPVAQESQQEGEAAKGSRLGLTSDESSVDTRSIRLRSSAYVS